MDDNDSGDVVWEAWNKYQKILEENKEEVFSYSMDF
jgi:hypothetical protein